MQQINHTANLLKPEQRPSHPNYRWIVLAIGVIAQASFSIGFSGLPATSVLMRSAYVMSNAELGVVLGAMALGVTLSEILWGLLTDFFGDRRVLLIGLCSSGVVFALMSFIATPGIDRIPSYLLLGMCLVVVGALGGSVNSSSGRAIMTWFKDGRRGLAMSIRQTAIPVGGALGAALLPWLALQYGFEAVFRALAFICLASTAATWLWLHEAEGHPSAQPAAPARDERSPLLRASVWRLALASSLLTVPQIAVLAFTGVFLRDERQVGLVVISGTLIAVQLIGGALRIWSGQFTDRHANRRTVMRAIGLCTGVSALALALFTHASVTLAVGLLGVTGLFANAWHGVAYTEIAVMAGPRHAGTALGMEGMTIFATAFLVPLLIPQLLAVSSWPVVWGVIGVTVLLAVPMLPGGQTTKL